MGVVWVLLVIGCGSETAQEEKMRSGSNSTGGREELTTIGRPATPVFGSSYVGPLTEIFGDVSIGQENLIVSNTVLRAAPGLRVELGAQSNVQDNVVVRARKDAVTVGEQSSLTHHAIVRDSQIGDSVFVGYSAEVSDSRVGDGTFIYHGALIDGVEIPENSFVGPGEAVTDQATADALPKIGEVGIEKYYDKREHPDTNREFARAYIGLYEREGYDAIVDVGPNPRTSFNPRQVEPQIGARVELGEFVRIVGDVQVGEDSVIGQRTTIRADEGDPIRIGRGALVDDRVTFHATRGTEIQIGQYLVAGDDAVLHGPLQMGNENVVGEGAVVFRARVGDNVQIGEGAVIAGPTGEELTLKIPDDTIIPGGAIVTSQEDLEALEN